MRIFSMKILHALLLATSIAATTAQANPGDPAAVREFKSQMALASKGDVEAQYRVGEMYEQGLGTAQDLSLAIIWYGKASIQGDKRATDRLSALDHSTAREVREVKENEQARVDSVMKALRQQEAEEAARARAAREKSAGEKAAAAAAAAEKAAAEARARQQAQDAARAREKAMAEASASTTRVAPARPAPEPATKPAETPKKESVDTERAEFSSNPCKGPQAKFLSTCK
jgi:colicin import membrane protein